MPITADRSLMVNAVDGDTALVTSTAVLTLPDNPTSEDVHSYAISRTDYTPVAVTDDQLKTLASGDTRTTRVA
ncbi:hypothetical protein EEB14_55995 [Rhodococcus sp. WS4]|nr:hypothetical protein EEB14_55995 [Rhodococcus sp. WS4]